jgi:hypothetical protein
MTSTIITLVGLLFVYTGIKREVKKTRSLANRQSNMDLDEQIREKGKRLDELTRACKSEERKIACLQVREVIFDYLQEYCREHEEILGQFFEKHRADFSSTPFFNEFCRMNKRLNATRGQVIHEIMKNEKKLLLYQAREQIPSLSTNDMVLLILTGLNYTDNSICGILKIGLPALKQRKTRLKEKIVSCLQVPNEGKECFRALVLLLFEHLQGVRNE